MNEFKYTFQEALHAVLFEGKYARGDGFAKGFFLKEVSGVVVVCDASEMYSRDQFFISKNIMNQKYMITNIATLKEMSKV